MMKLIIMIVATILLVAGASKLACMCQKYVSLSAMSLDDWFGVSRKDGAGGGGLRYKHKG